jgi:hypothetical protein
MSSVVMYLLLRVCLLSCCLAMGLCITIWKNSYRYCIQSFMCKYWQEWVSSKLWLLKFVNMSWFTRSVFDKKQQPKRNTVTEEEVQNIQAQLWISACNMEWRMSSCHSTGSNRQCKSSGGVCCKFVVNYLLWDFKICHRKCSCSMRHAWSRWVSSSR